MKAKDRILKKARKKGFKLILWDLDDSLIQTRSVFSGKIDEYLEVVCSKSEIDIEEIRPIFMEQNNKVFEVKSVNPERWDWVAERMVENFGRNEFVEYVPILKSIYKTTPEMVEGAMEVLETIYDSPLAMGMVTHATPEWTELKTEKIRHMFGHIETVDVNRHKSKEDWEKAAKILGAEAKDCIVIGDSLRNDVEPAGELGMAGILLPSVWSVYASGTMPNRAVEVEHVSKVFEGLEKLLEMESRS